MERYNIILSPHFDDAVLSLGGLLAKEGAISTVITFFAGKPDTLHITPWDLSSGFLNSNQAHKARVEENSQALEFLGVPQEQIVNLGHLDQQYRSSIFRRSSEGELQEVLLRGLLSFLEGCGQRELNLYAPGLELHQDHRLIKQVLHAAIPHLVSRNVHCFLYQDLPYACTLPQEKLSADHITSVANAETVVAPLLKEQVLKKTEAIMMYKSQILPLELFVGGDLSSRIMEFSRRQSEQFGTDFEYCEVLYKIL